MPLPRPKGSGFTPAQLAETRKLAAFALVLATSVALLFAIQNYYAPPAVLANQPFLLTLARQAITWYTWVLLLPVIVLAARRARRRGFADVPAQLALAVTTATLHAVIAAFTRWATHVSTSRDLGDLITASASVLFATNIVRYALVAAAVHAVLYHFDQAAAQRARLEALHSRLQPHFLFNALNSVLSLIRTNPRAAEEMLAQLSALLRASLTNHEADCVTLGQEADLLEKYLDIQRIRFGDRLTFDVAIPNDLRSATVPRFILQPHVENAITHGVGPREASGSVRVSASAHRGTLRLTVEDDGIGVNAIKEGIGVRSTRERLHHLYGGEQQFALRKRDGGGTLVTIELPLDGV